MSLTTLLAGVRRAIPRNIGWPLRCPDTFVRGEVATKAAPFCGVDRLTYNNAAKDLEHLQRLNDH
jgi:hypothetical protein